MFLWAGFNVLFCIISEWLVYLHSQEIRKPLLGSLFANSLTTATGMLIGVMGIVFSAMGLGIFTLLLPILATILVEYWVISRFKLPEVTARRCLVLVVRANLLSNLVMAILIALKSRH